MKSTRREATRSITDAVANIAVIKGRLGSVSDQALLDVRPAIVKLLREDLPLLIAELEARRAVANATSPQP